MYTGYFQMLYTKIELTETAIMVVKKKSILGKSVISRPMLLILK